MDLHVHNARITLNSIYNTIPNLACFLTFGPFRDVGDKFDVDLRRYNEACRLKIVMTFDNKYKTIRPASQILASEKQFQTVILLSLGLVLAAYGIRTTSGAKMYYTIIRYNAKII